MKQKYLIPLFVGLVAGNYLFQLLDDKNYSAALERSYFQGWALLCVAFINRFKRHDRRRTSSQHHHFTKTMNTTLALIKAYCLRNLGVASKRTPGDFSTKPGNALIYKGKYVIASAECHEHVAEDCPLIPWEEQQANAQFIATCAGAAEAGWRATVQEIEFLDLFESNARGWRDDNGCVGAALLLIHSRRVEILAAYLAKLEGDSTVSAGTPPNSTMKLNLQDALAGKFDEQLNIAFCEWLGWRNIIRNTDDEWHLSPSSDLRNMKGAEFAGRNSLLYLDGFHHPLPDHINSLESLGRVHEVELKLSDGQYDTFEQELAKAAGYVCHNEWPAPSCLRLVISATARQRVIAILQTVKPEIFEP